MVIPLQLMVAGWQDKKIERKFKTNQTDEELVNDAGKRKPTMMIEHMKFSFDGLLK